MTRDEVLREILAVIKDEARDLGHYGDRPSYAARIKQHADAALALLASVPEREPDGWVSAATAFDLQHMTQTLVERIIWKHSAPDHNLPVYIGAAQPAPTEEV
jgi:hypothetical protein